MSTEHQVLISICGTDGSVLLFSGRQYHRRRSYPLKSDSDRPIRFAVRSMGWVEIAEEDLTPERSSKAVNKCIVDLSLGRNDLLDVVGRWGDVSGAVCSRNNSDSGFLIGFAICVIQFL